MAKKKIGLAGRSGSGKDAIADFISDKYGHTKIAVADAIRDEAKLFLTNALINEAKSENLPISFDLVIKAFETAVWAKPTTPEIRVLLQFWGTEYRRSQNEDYWIDRFVSRMNLSDRVVISDVRVPEEMTAIRQAGGEVWLIVRPGIEQVGIHNHLTEVALENETFDQVIYNVQDLPILFEKVSTLIEG